MSGNEAFAARAMPVTFDRPDGERFLDFLYQPVRDDLGQATGILSADGSRFWDVDPVNDTLIWPPRTKAMFGISADRPVTMLDFYHSLHLRRA